MTKSMLEMLDPRTKDGEGVRVVLAALAMHALLTTCHGTWDPSVVAYKASRCAEELMRELRKKGDRS